MQRFTYLDGAEERTILLPEADCEVIAGVTWGEPHALFSPAYWFTQYLMRCSNALAPSYRSGETFAEEVVACLMGGYGLPAEVGWAAYERIRSEGFIADFCDDVKALELRLAEPLRVNGRLVRYRFWRQKARYIAATLRYLKSAQLPFDDAVQLRNRLLVVPGIGLKTASWIVRNWTSSDEVAILDIHVVRAGRLMGLFSAADRAGTRYFEMERRFVSLAKGLTVRTSALDALIWASMRNTPRLVCSVLERRGAFARS